MQCKHTYQIINKATKEVVDTITFNNAPKRNEVYTTFMIKNKTFIHDVFYKRQAVIITDVKSDFAIKLVKTEMV